jgi:hypothetical protein
MRVAKSVVADLHVLLYGSSIEDERCSDDFTPHQWVANGEQGRSPVPA